MGTLRGSNIRAMDPINESGAGEKQVQLAVECARDGRLAMSPSGESRAAGLISLIPLDSVEVAREQYDTQADEYKQSKLAPWRQYVEKHTADSLISLIGGVEGKNVIDLACGDGHYSRWLKGEKKAAGVLGVDLSEAMVNLANEEEAREPLGIQYTCCDAAKLGQWLKADVVFAAYLLNYASSYEELVHFVRAIYVTLPEGGIFVTMQNSPNDVVCHHPELKKYGVTKTCEQPGVEGATIKWTFFDGDQELCTVDNYYLSAQTHERAFREVGFRCVGFVNPNVSPTGLQLAESGYYDDFIDAAPIQGIFALK